MPIDEPMSDQKLPPVSAESIKPAKSEALAMATGNHMVKHIAGRNILVPFFVS